MPPKCMHCGEYVTTLCHTCDKAALAKHQVTCGATKKAATKRMLKAEGLLYQAAEILQQAQSQISVIVGGLNQNYAKIGVLRENVKGEMYDLERCRETGRCDLDSAWALGDSKSKSKGNKKAK